MALNRREFLRASALAGVAGSLAACSSGILAEPDVVTAGFGENARGTVTMWSRGGTISIGTQATIDLFHASQDRLRVELTPVPDGQFVTKLATAIRAGTVPDLVSMDDINSMLFIYRGVFTDLTPLVEALPYRQHLSRGHLSLATRNGRYYGVPHISDNSVLWYNTELLDRAGVDPAKAVTDFEALLEAARRIRALGKNVYAWSIAANSPGILGFVVQPHIWATGTDNISGPVGAQHGHIEGNQALRRTLEFYRTLWQEKLLPPANYADAGTTWGSDFLAGTIGFFPASYGVIGPASSAQVKARTGVALLCGPDGGTRFFDGGDNLCIPRGAANASGAWQFAKFGLEVSQQAGWPAAGFTPVRSDAATPAFRQKFPLDQVTLENIDRGYAPRTLAYNLLYNQPNSPFGAMFRNAVFGSGVDGALQAGQQQYDQVLKQAQL